MEGIELQETMQEERQQGERSVEYGFWVDYCILKQMSRPLRENYLCFVHRV
jgi:hypothetical protein